MKKSFRVEILKRKIAVAIIFVLGIICLTLEKRNLIDIQPLIYLFIFFLVSYILYSKNEMPISYYTPSSIMSLYVSFSFFMGTLAFKYKLVQSQIAGFLNFYFFNKMNVLTFYFIASIGVTLIAQTYALRARKSINKVCAIPAYKCKNWYPVNYIQSVISILIILFAILIPIHLPGGVGSFSSLFYMFAAILLTYTCKVKKVKCRAILYLIIAILLAYYFFDDRRLFVYYFFIVGLIELYDRRQYFIQLKTFLIGAICGSLIFIIVIAMSIQRGVGNYTVKSLFDSISHVSDYLHSEWAYTMLLHNFEGPSTLFHSYNALDYILENGEYRFGRTLIKVFFLPLSRDVFPFKPRSMVDEYTTIFYPKFRSEKGSYVPNLYVEAAWNFGVCGGLIFLTILFYLFDVAFYNMLNRLRTGQKIENVFLLSSYAFILFLFRGCGFDLYVLFVLIFYALAFLYKIFSLEKRMVKEFV